MKIAFDLCENSYILGRIIGGLSQERWDRLARLAEYESLAGCPPTLVGVEAILLKLSE